MRRQLVKVWHKNWTKSWGYAKLAVGGVMAGGHYAGQLVGNPDVKAALDPLHLDPKVLLALALLGAVTVLSAEH